MKLLIKNAIWQDKKTDIFIEGNKVKKIGQNFNFVCHEKIDAKGEKAVLPGLINCHTHAAMSLFKGYADDLFLKEWLEEKIWPLEEKINQEDVYWGTKLAALEMIKTGTVAFNDMYFYEDSSIEAIKEMGIRATIGLVLFDFSLRSSKESLKKKWDVLKKKKFKTISFSIAPHSIYAVSKENLIWAKNFAKKNNLILHLHLSETEEEVKDCLKKHKLRPVEYLEKIGFLGENCVLAHSVWLNDKEIKILGKRRCSLAYNPCSNLKLAIGGIFPYQKLKKAGANIVLGTDGSASNNSLDMISEMKFASLLQKHKEKNSTVLPAKEVINLPTLNAAKALKIDSGEIKEGKIADLILIDLNKIYFKPGHNFFSDLIYSASGDCVSDSICNGQIIMREGVIKGEKEIVKNASQRIKKLISAV